MNKLAISQALELILSEKSDVEELCKLMNTMARYEERLSVLNDVRSEDDNSLL